MIIRRASTDDAVAIATIHRTSRRYAMPWLPIVHTPDEDVDYFRKDVLPNQVVYVADRAGFPIGFIAFTETWLNHLYIAQAYLRHGIGSKLISIAKTETKTLNLWTFQRNQAARDFYARHGFVEVELTDGRSNEEQTPDVRMIWTA
ncbi:MAG: GNAT family N-acetyltransferase [Pseudomonadota bacterium]